MELFKVEMNWKIEEVWLDFTIELAQEKNSIVDNVFDKVTEACNWYNVTLNGIRLEPQQIALMVTRLYYAALEKLSDEWKNAFVMFIDESKDKLREYMNKKYNVEDKKVYYTVTNKHLLDYIKETNGIKTTDTTDDTNKTLNEKLDRILSKLEVWWTKEVVSKVDEPFLETIMEDKPKNKAVSSTKWQINIWWFTLDTWFSWTTLGTK